MVYKFFNYVIMSFLFVILVSSCNLQESIDTDDDANYIFDSTGVDINECSHRGNNVHVTNKVLHGFQAERIGWILGYLSNNVEWIVKGECGIDPFAGNYKGKREVGRYLRNYFRLINVSDIEVLNQEVIDGNVITAMRIHGMIPVSDKTINMEHVFSCEFDSRHKIDKMVISYNNYSMKLALTPGGKGSIVSQISVSQEATDTNWYYETQIKDLLAIYPYDILRTFVQPVPLSDIPSDGTLTNITLNGIPGELMETTGSSDEKIILFIHGGGYIIGDMGASRLFTYQVSKNTGSPVVAINYRLAPEYQFPSAPEDCIDAYEALLDTYDTEDIVIMGESTGGGLVFATLLLAKERNLPLPAAAVAISPWADLTNSCDTFTSNKDSDSYVPQEFLNYAVDLYLDGQSGTNPIASPVFADVEGLPPMYLTASSSELVADNAADMFIKLADANDNVIIEIGNEMLHCWPSMGLPESTESLSRIFNFINENLGSL